MFLMAKLAILWFWLGDLLVVRVGRAVEVSLGIVLTAGTLNKG